LKRYNLEMFGKKSTHQSHNLDYWQQWQLFNLKKELRWLSLIIQLYLALGSIFVNTQSCCWFTTLKICFIYFTDIAYSVILLYLCILFPYIYKYPRTVQGCARCNFIASSFVNWLTWSWMNEYNCSLSFYDIERS
jgi:hypothetical protein